MIPAFAQYPEDAIQHYMASEKSPWWERRTIRSPEDVNRWDLLVSFVPFLGDVPQRAEFTRIDSTDHTKLEGKVFPFHIERHKVRDDRALPAAAFPDGAFIYPGKVRPVLVVSHPHKWPNREVRGGSHSVTKPVFSVAPYYGVDQDGSRGGFPDDFLTRIRQAMYPQFFWDHLPSGLPQVGLKDCSSILRFDQIFPVSRIVDAKVAGWAPTGYTLSDQARPAMEEWLSWHHTAGYKPKGNINEFLAILKEKAQGSSA